MTYILWFVSGLVGVGVGMSVVSGDAVSALYGVGIITILACMHDVNDIRKYVGKLGRG